jgi:polar amino acid transport system ATP-binding protein
VWKKARWSQSSAAVGDKLVFMHHGKVHEVGDPKELFVNPRTPELAQFIGMQQG